MKKTFLLLSLLALPLAFTSCSSDDDNGTPIGKTLSDPELKELADQYYTIELSEQSEQQQQQLEELAEQIILKFGEDGKAWIYSKNGKVVENAEECDDPRPESLAPKVRGLKYKPEKWYVYVGEYTDGGEKGYEIKGAGNVKIDGNKITLSFGDVTIQNLVAKIMKSPITAIDIVNKACRTWNIVQTKVQVEGGNLETAIGKIYQNEKANDLAYIAQSIDAEVTSIQIAENLQEYGRYTKIKTISLSRTGAIEINYANNAKDVGTITGFDAQGNITLMWNGENLSNQYISGDLGITAKIKNNYLVLSFTSEVVAVDIVKPYKVELEFVLEWAK